MYYQTHTCTLTPTSAHIGMHVTALKLLQVSVACRFSRKYCKSLVLVRTASANTVLRTIYAVNTSHNMVCTFMLEAGSRYKTTQDLGRNMLMYVVID